ncbi:hypothetical protein L195_g058774, partial [Trifolium pratense]
MQKQGVSRLIVEIGLRRDGDVGKRHNMIKDGLIDISKPDTTMTERSLSLDTLICKNDITVSEATMHAIVLMKGEADHGTPESKASIIDQGRGVLHDPCSIINNSDRGLHRNKGGSSGDGERRLGRK